MIVAKGSLTGKMNAKQSLSGEVNRAIEYIAPSTQSKEVIPTKELQTILPDDGIFALSKVKVQPIPNEYIIPTGTKQINITENGTTTEDVTNYATAQITTNVVNQDYEDALVAFGVEEDLADSIEALTTYSNETTGESDTTLSEAVRSLADGYGNITLNEMANHILPIIQNPTISVEEIPFSNAFNGCNNLKGILNLPNVTNLPSYSFNNCTEITEVRAPKLVTFGQFAFNLSNGWTEDLVHCYFDSLEVLPQNGLGGRARVVLHMPKVKEFANMCFNGAYGYLDVTNGFVIIPESVEKVGSDLTRNTGNVCKGYKFYGKPDTIDSNMVGLSRGSVFDIYVPWSEGEVAGAPWGGTNATVHYNTIYDENGDVVSYT